MSKVLQSLGREFVGETTYNLADSPGEVRVNVLFGRSSTKDAVETVQVTRVWHVEGDQAALTEVKRGL